MKVNVKKLVICIAIPLAVGVVSALLTRGAMSEFGRLKQPLLSPPAWLFPIVWTILYTLMGISSYLILETNVQGNEKESAFATYFYQLTVNFLWPIFFFNFGWYLFSFLWLLLLWGLVWRMIQQFGMINKVAAWINIPYIIWLTIAAYLNFGIWWLNK